MRRVYLSAAEIGVIKDFQNKVKDSLNSSSFSSSDAEEDMTTSKNVVSFGWKTDGRERNSERVTAVKELKITVVMQPE
jgi:hypothetical protein